MTCFSLTWQWWRSSTFIGIRRRPGRTVIEGLEASSIYTGFWQAGADISDAWWWNCDLPVCPPWQVAACRLQCVPVLFLQGNTHWSSCLHFQPPMVTRPTVSLSLSTHHLLRFFPQQLTIFWIWLDSTGYIGFESVDTGGRASTSSWGHMLGQSYFDL